MSGSIFCYLEKAFNSVNHDLLLSKLPYYGISGKAKLLLASYLLSRYQRVQIINSSLNANTVSKWTKIKYGVPQGLNLFLLLLLLYTYIIDVPKAINHKAIPIIFADDTNILITSPNNINFQNNLNIIFGQLNKWSYLICFPSILTKLISFNLLIKVQVLLIYKLCMKIKKFVQVLKKIFLAV